jgi:hypothetical protein
MGPRARAAGVLIVVGLMTLIGCGGGSSSTSDSSSTADSDSTAASKSAESESSAAEPSKEFLSGGKNGKLAKIGKESSAAEREAASRALEKSLNAREAGDWKTQCETLSASAVEQIEQASALTPGTSCAKALEAQAGSLPPFARANTMTGPIDAFRINEGFNGFAFYHGTQGRDYVIPLIKQGGEWKVVVPQEEEVR